MLLTVAPEVDVDKIINVETHKEFLQVGKKMLDQRGVDNIEFMLKDANDLNYQQLTDSSAVVNTSLIDIPGTDWFTNIPAGTMVVMQARDHVEDNQFRNPEDIQQTFPLDQVLYSGSLELEDPETEYSRFMVIGIK
jgi:protein-L-isoaspartate O-methyltransferase